MAPTCQFDLRVPCMDSCVIGFEMCIQHLQTPRGLRHAKDRIDSGEMFTYFDLEEEIRSRSEAPIADYHTTALEQMSEALEEAQRWSRQTREMLYSIPYEDWRFTDRHGQEQQRMEVRIYEDAMDRVARIVERTSKMAIKEKLISLGRAQTELVIRLTMGTIEALDLDVDTFDRARTLLLDKFRREAHLSARHEAHVEKILESADAPKAILRSV